MKRLFNSIRWIIVILLIIPAYLLLVGSGIFIPVSETVTSPEYPKKWLSNSGVYENAVETGVNEIIRQAGEETDNVSINEVTKGLADEEKIKEIANNVFTAEWVKTESENIIDSIYSFLNEDTNTIDFTIDLTQPNENMEEELSALFVDMADSLPACSTDETIPIEDFDLFEADCLPSNISSSDIEEFVQNEIDTIPYFQQNELSSEELSLNQFEGIDNLQYIFGIIKSVPFVLLFACLLFIFIIFLLVPRFRRKLKTIGYIWSLSGLTIIVLSFLAKVSFSSFILDFIIGKIPQGSANLLTLLKSPVEAAYADITAYILITGSVVLIIGIAISISSLFFKRK